MINDIDDIFDYEEELTHYGTERHSGRYPWGSGKEPFQRSGDFLSRINDLKKRGMNEKEIAETLGLSTTRLRAQESLAKEERRGHMIARARSLEADGLNRVQIAAKMGLPGESSVRSLLNSDSEARMNIAIKTAENLKSIVDEKGMIDIGIGSHRVLNISEPKLTQAIEILKVQGYEVYGGRVPQQTNPGKHTTLRVLAVPGTEHKEIFDYGKIGSIEDYITRDGGDTFEKGFVYPKSLDSDRIMVRYNEEGGREKDGVIELRRGVDDISLGNSTYSQVRVLVDDKYYLKGMAVYSDDMPDGVDVIFNTNKMVGTDKFKTFKKITDDPDNPFGSSIKEHGGQSYYIDDKGEKQLSVINKRADEGDWNNWSNTLSSQFLSKQPMSLINKQLNLATSEKQAEFDEINALTNPTVKKALLTAFADDCDSAASHLRAASLPGQTYKVIIPLPSMKDNEVYAPTLQDGTQVALVRYPHGGTFEIPILTVNNRNREGKQVLTSNPSDAIGINSNVADRMSGADFDGDTVMVIPITDRVKIKSTPPLKQLEGFDTIMAYGPDKGPSIDGSKNYSRGGKNFSPMKESATQNQMGVISNLITDMTLKGASNEELSRAVKHSMVVIDANKHKLDYKQSEKDNGIPALHKKYQLQTDETGRQHMGASTLISKARSETSVPERKEGAPFARDTGQKLEIIDFDKKIYIDPSTGKEYKRNETRTLYTDPNTGEKLYSETGRSFSRVQYKNENGKDVKASVYIKDVNGKFKTPGTYVNEKDSLYYKDAKGEYKKVTDENVIVTEAKVKSNKMNETPDARRLSSGTPQEEAYASYANKMKALANEARKEIIVIKEIDYSKSARTTYQKEVDSLDFKLNESLLNAPRERQAQVIAASIVKAKKQKEPNMTNEAEKKLKQQEINRARNLVGAKRKEVQITDREWEAIQAGAISKTKLSQIIANADMDVLRQLSMPRTSYTLSPAKIRRLKNMAKSGYTTAEIANALGISPSSVTTHLKGDE